MVWCHERAQTHPRRPSPGQQATDPHSPAPGRGQLRWPPPQGRQNPPLRMPVAPVGELSTLEATRTVPWPPALEGRLPGAAFAQPGAPSRSGTRRRTPAGGPATPVDEGVGVVSHPGRDGPGPDPEAPVGDSAVGHTRERPTCGARGRPEASHRSAEGVKAQTAGSAQLLRKRHKSILIVVRPHAQCGH